MDTIAISDLRQNLPTVIDEVNQALKRFIVTVFGKPKAVVMSLEELESLEETAEVVSIPGASRAIKESLKELELAKKGKVKLIPASEVFKKHR
ncbi:type II toxin-antitoxin system Phd/YefM family antitoxin [Candidatus Gottesmanbacteria bacterium]|nr:type II toxin-antitoxin system Phd/YefM family antitoxin [Candidatus Gottesmanbacteria bacterium]MBI5465045.1 type II toxin-antitoxin system Phd/YefM family antitoxin [Candidatus Gottesmanbacteria bacterium]